MDYEKFLPIGSVVLLKGAKKRMMVVGFCCINDDGKSKKVYDYAGCLYPEGQLSSSKTLLFNHEQIERVDHLGFSDDEDKQFKKKLSAMLEKVNSDNLSK